MILLAQCLCGPRRHAIIAMAADDQEGTPDAVLARFRAAVAGMIGPGGVNPWCALCGAPASEWECEIGATRFHTMEEAKPELTVMETANLLAREHLIESGRAFDGPKKGIN